MTVQNKNVPALRFPEFNGDWEFRDLGNIADKYYQGINTTADNVKYQKNGIPVIQAKHITEEVLNFNDARFLSIKDFNYYKTKYKPVIDEILISNIGTLGKIVLIEEDIDFLIAWNIFKVTPNRIICSSKFLTFSLKRTAIDGYFEKIKTGNATKFVNKDDMLAITVNLPTLPEQQKIAAFLSAVDEKIQQLTKKKELLEQYKKGVMQKIFSQEIRFKDDNGNDFVEWEEKQLKHFIIEHRGGAPLKPSDFVKESSFEVIPKKGIVSGGHLILDLENPTFCSQTFFEQYPKAVIDNSFLVTTLRDLVPSAPNIGYIVKYKSDKKYMLAQGVYGLKLDDNLFGDFLIQYSNTEKYRKTMQTIKVGSTQVHITNDVFFGIKIPVPSIPEQIKIARFLFAIDEKINLINQQLEKTKEFKKGLLQQMFV